MIEFHIPGCGDIQLEHLVCDVNGTLAIDGQLIDGVRPILETLRDRLTIHLLTADTWGQQQAIDQQLNLVAVRLQPGEQPGDEARQKAAFVQQLGAEHVAAVGQGANDSLMLQCAKIGIGVLSREGLAVETLREADIIAPDILSALEMLEKPLRLVATLRK